MDPETFKESLAGDAPPAELTDVLKAMWFAANGDWDQAHKLAQKDNSPAGAWVHAYLHRVEGDESNAGYWYARAGKPHGNARLRNEWTEIVLELLQDK